MRLAPSLSSHHVVVEAVVGGQVGVILPHPEVPLAHDGGAVAHRLQALGDRGLIVRQA